MERNKPFITVAMPVYNVETHLRQAVNSILKQTLQDFEIILVNDCSPDGSGAICDEFAQQDKRIKVINHEVNLGVSEARNSGMKEALGKYIWFMDSDDYVERDLLQDAFDSLQKNPAEIVVFGLIEDYYDVSDNLHHSEEIKPEARQFQKQNELRKHIITLEWETLYGYVWNKIYDLDYLKKLQLKYENITMIEDIVFNVKYCMDIERMNILSGCYYHYNKRRDNSLTSKFIPDYYKLHRRRIDLLYHQYNYWGLCNEEVKSILGALYARYIFSAIQRNCDEKAGMNHKSRRIWIKRLKEERLFHELIPYAKSEGGLLNIMLRLLQMGNVIAILSLGRVIFICKNSLPMVFSVLKQKR